MKRTGKNTSPPVEQPAFHKVAENLCRLESSNGYCALLKRGGKQFRRSVVGQFEISFAPATCWAAHRLSFAGLFAPEVQAETVKHFEGGAQEEQRTLQETAGIPTGLAPDIARQVEVRRAKRKSAPDNLAPEKPESRA